MAARVIDKKHKWTYDDEVKLLQAIEVYGRNWSVIQKACFPRGTPSSLKNKYYMSLKDDGLTEIPVATPRMSRENSVANISKAEDELDLISCLSAIFSVM